MAGAEGTIEIGIAVRDRNVTSVRIDSTRPVHASRVFQGKRITEVQQLLPLLFSVCGTAQACAGVRAWEQASGVIATPHCDRLRTALVDMESVREHLWRILLDWPAMAGEAADRPSMAEVAAIQREYALAICPGSELFRPGGTDCRAQYDGLAHLQQRCAALQSERVFGMPPDQWLQLDDPADLRSWAAGAGTPSARLLHRVFDAGWEAAGASRIDPLPALTSSWLNRALDEAAFVAQPTWSGRCCETSCMTRTTTPLLTRLTADYGGGLLSRLVARLTEVAALTGRMRPQSLNPGGSAPVPTEPINPGIGQSTAARGQLVHRVTLRDNLVLGYQILAPTEWNFHPNGVVAQSLSLLAGEASDIEHQARLLIDAIDPCVSYVLHLDPDE